MFKLGWYRLFAGVMEEQWIIRLIARNWDDIKFWWKVQTVVVALAFIFFISSGVPDAPRGEVYLLCIAAFGKALGGLIFLSLALVIGALAPILLTLGVLLVLGFPFLLLGFCLSSLIVGVGGLVLACLGPFLLLLWARPVFLHLAARWLAEADMREKEEKAVMAALGLGNFAYSAFNVFEESRRRREQQAGRYATQADVEGCGRFGPDGVFVGYWPLYGGKRHAMHYTGENFLLTFGKPGSGKGTTVITPALLSYPGSVFVIDPKGENAAITAKARRGMGQEVFCLNPFGLFPDRLGDSARFNPLDRLDKENPDFDGDVRALAHELIINTGRADDHWPDSARALLVCLIMHVCTKPGEVKTLPRVRSLLMSPIDPDMKDGQPKAGTFQALIADMMDTKKNKFLPLAELAGQFSYISEEIQSVISTTRTQTAWLADRSVAACLGGTSEGLDFSAMRQKKISVFVILPEKHLDAQSRWLRLLVASGIEALTARETEQGDARVLFILDEFGQLGHLRAIERSLGIGRGYGVQLWPFLQDFAQLKQHYRDRVASFFSTAGVLQFFTPNDLETADEIVKRAGRVVSVSMSKGTRETSSRERAEGMSGESANESEGMENLLSAQELMDMKNPDPKRGEYVGEQIVFVEGSKATFKAVRVFYGQDPNFAGLADTNPYVKG